MTDILSGATHQAALSPIPPVAYVKICAWIVSVKLGEKQRVNCLALKKYFNVPFDGLFLRLVFCFFPWLRSSLSTLHDAA